MFLLLDKKTKIFGYQLKSDGGYIMSHMVETMAYAGEVPWHKLGNPVTNDLSPKQMQIASGTDWEVEKVPMVVTLDTDAQNRQYSSPIIVPDKKALVRTSDNTVLDVVGDDWTPLQNEQAFEFFHDFVCAGKMSMETAGSLENGKRVFVLAKINEAFDLVEGKDVIEQYLLFSNPFKYGMSIDIRNTPVRVVCNNTITFALNQKSNRMVKVNHRSKFDPELVKETLGFAMKQMDEYKEAAKFLGKKKYTNESIVEYFDRVFPKTYKSKKDKAFEQSAKLVSLKDIKAGIDNAEVNKNFRSVSRNAKLAIDALDNQPGAELGAGTFWQAFNAVTYMTDHVMGRSDDTRMSSAWFGINKTRKENALKTAIEFAEAA